MLKRLAIVILLASVLPIYGYKESPKTSGDKSYPDSSHNPPPTPSGTARCIVKEEGTAIECQWPKDVPESKFSRLFSPENAPNIGLFFIGLGGVLVAVVTLVLIRAQVIEMRRQVTASHDGLRAWLGIGIREIVHPIIIAANPLDELLTPRLPTFVWEIANYGQTPAFMKSIAVSNAAYSTPKGDLLMVGSPLTLNGFLGQGQTESNPFTLPADARDKCEKGQMFWRTSFKVEYEDAFGRKHETMASFHYHVPQSPSDPRRKGFHQDVDPTTNYNT